MMSITAAAESSCGSDQQINKLEGDEEMGGKLSVSHAAASVSSSGEDSSTDIFEGTIGHFELLDPAIVARGHVIKPLTTLFTYSRERLLQIKELPLSRVRPEFLDWPSTENLAPIWLLDRGNGDRKRPDTPSEDGGREVPIENHKRRSGDPRERIRKEQDGIVLSPQRRSFNLGCSAPLVDSPLPKPEREIGGHRNDIPTGRRIGSGRIVTRDVSWDYKTDPVESQEFSFRPGGGAQIVRDRRENDRNIDDRFERRPFGRDFERERDREREKDRHQTRNGRFGNDRRRAYNDGKDDEPEWFSGGPTSQNDTIELRGFEDIPEERTSRKQKQNSAQKKKNKEKDQRKLLNENQSSGLKDESPPKGPGARSTPTPGDKKDDTLTHSPIKEINELSLFDDDAGKGDKLLEEKKTEQSTLQNNKESATALNDVMNSHNDFNIEDFLKLDSIPELLTNGVGTEISGGSRFSQWFRRDSPIKQMESRRSSLQDELLINNLINEFSDISEPTVSIPIGDSDTYFAPISPAAASTAPQLNAGTAIGSAATNMNSSNADKSVSLMEMLQRANKQKTRGAEHSLPKNIPDVPGKVLSLEEIEANIRRDREKVSGTVHHTQKGDEDMAAFKKLLAQVSGGHAIPATSNGPAPQKPQPMSLLQMLNKSQQDENAARNAVQNANHPPQVPPELVMKLHQVQQHQRQQDMNMIAKLMQASGRPYQASPLPSDNMLGSNLPNIDLLKRPEAQALLQGLKQGEITAQNLIQQLANPAMQPRHRELISSILNLLAPATGGAPNLHASPRAVSPGGPPPSHPELLQQFIFPQQQQLRVSPLPPNGGNNKYFSAHAAYCVSPILATSPNTLSVHHPVIPPRIPSPRELQAHTQSIMQQALIKKKLEEQRENYRKKQEMQQRALSPGAPPTTNAASPAKHQSSPTPLAFTPTSVLRKMTAEKEPENPSNKDKSVITMISNSGNIMLGDNGKKSSQQQSQTSQPNLQNNVIQQGRPVTGMRQPPPQQQPQQQQQQQQQMSHGWGAQPGPIKQQGRPILKGNNYQQFNNPATEYLTQRSHPHLQSTGMFPPQAAAQRAKMGTPYNIQPSAGHRQSANNIANASNFARMQMQMAQMQQRTGVNPSLQQLLQMQSQNYENRGIPITGRPVTGNSGMQFSHRASPLPDAMSGELSPTSNQLARWFPPELLAQARAGKLPNMPPVSLAQGVCSLEELERIQQAAAAVHN